MWLVDWVSDFQICVFFSSTETWTSVLNSLLRFGWLRTENRTVSGFSTSFISLLFWLDLFIHYMLFCVYCSVYLLMWSQRYTNSCSSSCSTIGVIFFVPLSCIPLAISQRQPLTVRFRVQKFDSSLWPSYGYYIWTYQNKQQCVCSICTSSNRQKFVVTYLTGNNWIKQHIVAVSQVCDDTTWNTTGNSWGLNQLNYLYKCWSRSYRVDTSTVSIKIDCKHL